MADLIPPRPPYPPLRDDLAPIQPTGVGTAWPLPNDNKGGPGLDAVLANDPGDTNPPVIFEPDADLAGNTSELWIIASGGPFWGGAQVHVSLDDTTYSLAGFLVAGASQGVLTAPFPAGADPDTVNTLSVDLSMSRGQLISGTAADADFMLQTLAYCDGELVAFSNATLTGVATYDLNTYIRRGTRGTVSSAHEAGTQFAWVQNPYNYEFPISLRGHTVWFKFPSFNTLGAQLQDIADCVAYPYTLRGVGVRPGGGGAGAGAGGYMLPLVTGEYAAMPVVGPGASIAVPVAITDGRGQFIGVPI
jgi:hypothetical protein